MYDDGYELSVTYLLDENDFQKVLIGIQSNSRAKIDSNNYIYRNEAFSKDFPKINQLLKLINVNNMEKFIIKEDTVPIKIITEQKMFQLNKKGICRKIHVGVSIIYSAYYPICSLTILSQ